MVAITLAVVSTALYPAASAQAQTQWTQSCADSRAADRHGVGDDQADRPLPVSPAASAVTFSPPLSNAKRLVRGRHSACSILAASDALLSELQLPSTWKRGRVPRAAIKRPVGLLRAAERATAAQGGAAVRGRTQADAAPSVPQGRQRLHSASTARGRVQSRERVPRCHWGSSIPQRRSAARPALGADLQTQARRAGGPTATAASDPLSFFRNSDVGIPPAQASPQEPTTAEGGNVVWYTGNSSDGLSTNAGRTFTLFNPSTILPDSGLPFCCDQVVSYSPQRNLFVWVMQYWCGAGSSNPATNNCTKAGTTSNRIRIAVASPQSLIANASNPGAAWTYWDITPQTFGQPPGSWFDRSDMSVNLWNMQWTVDVLRANQGVSSLLTRVSLADLANRGTISISYITNATSGSASLRG